jgi:hypothetical protein
VADVINKMADTINDAARPNHYLPRPVAEKGCNLMFKIAVFAISAATACCGPVTAFAQSSQNNAAIVNVVKSCVGVVHNDSSAGYLAVFYQNFDAFYNPATGVIENNVVNVGGQEALFAFNKCMAGQGFPLKYGQ